MRADRQPTGPALLAVPASHISSKGRPTSTNISIACRHKAKLWLSHPAPPFGGVWPLINTTNAAGAAAAALTRVARLHVGGHNHGPAAARRQNVDAVGSDADLQRQR